MHCGIGEKNLKQQMEWFYITAGVKFSHHETPSSPALYIVIFVDRSFSNVDATALLKFYRLHDFKNMSMYIYYSTSFHCNALHFAVSWRCSLICEQVLAKIVFTLGTIMLFIVPSDHTPNWRSQTTMLI